MTDYWRAPDVATIADDLIRDVEDHKQLDGVRIEYLFRDRASKSKGRLVLAKARKISGLNAYLAQSSAGIRDLDANEDLFVVEVAYDTWQRLDEHQRKALVDHELCHLRVDLDDDSPKLSIRGHDLEEFGCIVERHGLWASNVASFGTAVAEQMAMAVDEVESFLAGLGETEADDGRDVLDETENGDADGS